MAMTKAMQRQQQRLRREAAAIVAAAFEAAVAAGCRYARTECGAPVDPDPALTTPADAMAWAAAGRGRDWFDVPAYLRGGAGIPQAAWKAACGK